MENEFWLGTSEEFKNTGRKFEIFGRESQILLSAISYFHYFVPIQFLPTFDNLEHFIIKNIITCIIAISSNLGKHNEETQFIFHFSRNI